MLQPAMLPGARTLFGRQMLFAAFLCSFLIAAPCARPQQSDPDVANRIRDAALHHSQVIQLAGYLSDVNGPRLTGSPNLKSAEMYAREKLKAWDLANAHLEPWGPFGRGWSLQGFTANMRSPAFSPLIAYPKAWSPGTTGTVRGQPILLDVKNSSDLEKYKGKLKDRIVLFSPVRQVDPLFAPPAQRRTDDELLRLASVPAATGPPSFHPTPEQRATQQLNDEKWRLILSEGAAVVLQPSSSDAGTVYVTSATVPYSPDVPLEKRARAWEPGGPAVTPQVVVAAEQYNRIVRLLEHAIPVELEVNVSARFYDDDPMSYNVIAEIPGADLKDEVVMIGASIDSWHSATGATDNAVGAATALEVIRILQSLGLKPRRTIRIGLWSAEEQGSLGSRAYVTAHLRQKITASEPSGASRIEPRSEHETFDAYFNFDYGTGRIRGLFLQGNEAALPVFRTVFAPLKDLGASTLSLSSIGATDHIPFDEVGLPAFQWIRDYMEGQNTRAPHTNMDTYDHILEDDLQQSAAVAACVIYDLAMRDEKVPRKTLPH